MAHRKKWKWPRLRRQDAAHAARTAAAAAISLEIAYLLRLPEPYWATITTLIVMQSTLGPAFAGSTLAMVRLVSWAKPAWVIEVHRFVEVSVGIAAGLILTALWPGEDVAPSDGR